LLNRQYLIIILPVTLFLRKDRHCWDRGTLWNSLG